MSSGIQGSVEEARLYWTQQMDAAFVFMERMRHYPLVECGEGMLPLNEAAKGLRVEFSTTRINGIHPRIFSIREGLIQSFRNVAADINRQGWILKVEEGYRTPEMQRALSHSPYIFDTVLHKVIWELNGKIPDANLMLRRLSALIATRCRVGTHVSGSAIDVSVIDEETGREVDRGGPYLEISEKTPMYSPFLNPEQRRNRLEIRNIFRKHDWHAYPYEFWHFSSGDSYAEVLAASAKPSRYGPITCEKDGICFMDTATSDALLEPLEFYEAQIAAALKRLAVPAE